MDSMKQKIEEFVNEQVRVKTADLNARVEAISEERDDLKEEITRLNNRLEAKNNRISYLESAKDDLKKRVNELAAANKRHQDARNALVDANRELIDERDALKDQVIRQASNAGLTVENLKAMRRLHSETIIARNEAKNHAGAALTSAQGALANCSTPASMPAKPRDTRTPRTV